MEQIKEMEDESFELLSSMSPKVKHCQKHFRKGTTVLALRKSLRRSSVYDKSIHTIKNEDLVITEISSTSTAESSRSKSSTNLCKKLVNRTAIIIHDSDSDLDESKAMSHKSKSMEIKIVKENETHSALKEKKSSLLSEDKLEDIKQWIDNVNLQNEVTDSTFSPYSELSTICGEENGTNFVTERSGQAVNSTVIGSIPIRFDQLLKQNTKLKNSKVDDELIIDESYTEIDTSLTKITEVNEINKGRVTNVFGGSSSTHRNRYLTEITQVKHHSDSDEGLNLVKGKNKNDSRRKLQNKTRGGKSIENNSDRYSFSSPNKNFNTRIESKNSDNWDIGNYCFSDKKPNENKYSEANLDNDINQDNESAEINDKELTSMLDDLYGDKWREKEEHVLPKSEPRKRMPRLNNINITNTERKPKLSILYKNPYLESEKWKSNNLLHTLQKSRLKKYLESPMMKQLNNFCDSDTDSKDFENKELANPRVKLNFNDSDDDDDGVCKIVDESQNAVDNEGTTSKYFEVHVRSKNFVRKNRSNGENDSDKENLDELFLGQSLEERITKKNNGVKGICEGGKKKEKDCSPLTKKSDIASSKRNKIKNVTKKGEKTDTKKLSSGSISSGSSDYAWEKEISKIIHESKPVNGKYSFLASLSVTIPILQCDMSARIYRNNFKLYKNELLSKLFQLYNEKVFENAIPQDTALEWNDRMRGTAGFCYCKKICRKSGVIERKARIVLSTKVIDSACRLRDTLIHEMCHAATWIVNCVSDGHGPYWKSWAYKAMETFPELPPIKRCHDYVISYKYTYKCTQCGYSIGRHSKSLDIERKRCGHCLGKFEVLLNKVSKTGKMKSVPATPKKEATGFALFVKENYGVYKQNLKHGEVMKLLGQKFQEMKLKPS